MALGNSNSSAQSRGKNRAVVVKRRKEVVLAKDYTAFQGSEVKGAMACGTNNGDVNITYYHDGSGVLPYDIGDKIYTRKRQNDTFKVLNGHIKAGPDRGRYFSIEVESGAVKRYFSC